MIDAHRLQVDELHTLYIEEHGNPRGTPILFLHGGPGTGISPSSTSYFDPSHYRIILFDQRGSGQSTPFACVEKNTTWDLVSDIEKIRLYLNVPKWIIFGGSWGSLLGLAYAQSYPQNILGLILRGIFFCDHEDLRWLLYDGAARIWPKEWHEFTSLVPGDKRHDLIESYWELIHSHEPGLALQAMRAWTLWEARNLTLRGDQEAFNDFFSDKKALSVAKIELHYFRHLAFLSAGQLLDNCHKIAHLPAKIIHGRYDTICPFSNAWQLHCRLPHSELIAVEGAGHAGLDPAIRAALIDATEDFKRLC